MKKKELRKDQIKIIPFSGNSFDTFPSFLLKIKSNLYFFNIPEMTQKNRLTKNIKFHTLKSIFITSLYPDSVGGLSTFILQSFDQSKTLFQIVGPNQIPEVILFKPDYVGEKITDKFKINVLSTFSNDDIEVIPIFLPKSICFSVFLKTENKHILVVDCRSLDDLQYLTNIQQYPVIIHLTPLEVLVKTQYVQFFTSHVNEKIEKTNFCFMPSAAISNIPSNKYYSERSNSILQPLSYGKTLKPPPNFINILNEQIELNFDSKSYQNDKLDEYIDLDFEKLQNMDSFDIFSQITEFNPSLPTFQKFALTVLGSTTKFVSKERNNSGYLIHTNYGFVVLDPSEGYLLQMTRKFGPSATKYILKNIECIWVSHFHQDHCFGLSSLLRERSKITDKNIYFYSPQCIIEDVQNLEKFYGDFHITCHNREPKGRDQVSPDDISGVPNELPINDHLRLMSIDVFHTIKYAKGCMLIIDNDTKIAFSGDHSFNRDKFAESFPNCDLLIHEATFPDNCTKAVGIIKHCFLNEAIKTVNIMNPKFAILTHLSQRYNPKELTVKLASNVLFAFDFLEITSENIQDVFDNVK